LKRAGYSFDVVFPSVNESVHEAMSPRRAVMAVAMRKLEAVCAGAGEGVVVAADQAMEFEGKVVGKPGTAEAAVRLLMRLRGKEHRLLTALAVRDCRSGRIFKHLDAHRIRLRRFTRREAERYVEIDRPMDCAGGIKIESRGVLLVEKARGEDYTAIIGLPMMALSGILKKLGIDPLLDGRRGTKLL
jgi:septum formation protein